MFYKQRYQRLDILKLEGVSSIIKLPHCYETSRPIHIYRPSDPEHALKTREREPRARFSKVPIINGPVKLLLFTYKIEFSIVLHPA